MNGKDGRSDYDYKCFQMFQKQRYFGQKSPWRREPGPQRTDATRIRSGSYIILNQSGTSVMWEPEETRDMKNNNVKFSVGVNNIPKR